MSEYNNVDEHVHKIQLCVVGGWGGLLGDTFKTQYSRDSVG